MENEASRILEFLGLSEQLKRELRHSWLSDGRRESVAEHTWQMALVALLAYRHLEHPVDIGRVLKIILVHDLVEALAEDIPYFEVGERKELKAERGNRGDPNPCCRRYRTGNLRAVARIRGAYDGRGQVCYGAG